MALELNLNMYYLSFILKVFEDVYHDSVIVGIASKVFAIALSIALASYGFSLLIPGIPILASTIISGVTKAYLTMYESTYANEPPGNKYLWSYYSVYQYDKNTALALASEVGWYGKLASGKTVTVVPNLPGLSSPVAYDYSEWADNIASNAGTNNWYVGNAP